MGFIKSMLASKQDQSHVFSVGGNLENRDFRLENVL